jgi:hypothetical protein
MKAAKLAVALLLTTLPAWPACRPIDGAAQLWTRPGLRFLLVGEMHGTTEGPAIFGDLVCAAVATGRPVVAALERPVEEQDDLSAFRAKELLAHKVWHIFDGRSSRAMLDLIEALHGMKLAELVAFDAGAGQPNAERNALMADALKAAAVRHPGALVIVLTGNLHASKKLIEGFGQYPFAAMLLPPDATLSLFLADRGGTAWTQQSEGCGPHPIRSSRGDKREVSLEAGRSPMSGYDGVLSTGLVSTASPPALGADLKGCSAE